MWIKPKYRIKQIGNKYYPQQKKFLSWKYIEVKECSLRMYNKDKIDSVNDDEFCIFFPSLKNATDFITNYKNNYLGEFNCRGWTIGSYWCNENRTFYYIEVSQHKFYSDCSETVCEQIMQYEDDKLEKERKDNEITIHEYRES